MEEIVASKLKQLRRSYGFDEVAIIPGDTSINPEQTNIDFKIGDINFSIPIIAASMDAVTDVNFAALMSRLGGLAVLNLEGIQARYDNADEMLKMIAGFARAEATAKMQKIYTEPIKKELIAKRISQLKKKSDIVCASLTPQRVEKYYKKRCFARRSRKTVLKKRRIHEKTYTDNFTLNIFTGMQGRSRRRRRDKNNLCRSRRTIPKDILR